MNIFVTDKDPVVAAQNLCDSHAVKMTLESAQLLCTAHWVAWQKMLSPPAELKGKKLKEWLAERIPHSSLVPAYSMTHTNHPSSKWTRECWGNYNWLVRHAIAQCNEYTVRYGKVMKCEEVVRWANKYPPPSFDSNDTNNPLGMTPFAVAMPDEYKVVGDPVQSYRNYYHGSKARFARWRHSAPPSWWSPHTYRHGDNHDEQQAEAV